MELVYRSDDGEPAHGSRVRAAIDAARRAQRRWEQTSVSSRLRLVRRMRHAIAERPSGLARAAGQPDRPSIAETLSAEVGPLADACRFLEREAAALLRDRRLGARGRPGWLFGSRVVLRRDPLGVVLVIAPTNYPLLLPGVQVLQALVSGNAVLLKPGAGGGNAALALARLVVTAGFDRDLLQVLDESPRTAGRAIDAGVDKILLTGSAATGRTVLAHAGRTITPAVAELSGCDAMFVLDDADLDLAARALRFGLSLNGGATCIAPRRVFVHHSVAADFERKLVAALREAPRRPLPQPVAERMTALVDDALRLGARRIGEPPHAEQGASPLVMADARPSMAVTRADIFAPIAALMVVDDDRQALELAADCPYALGASVFGRRRAADLARRVHAGVVVVNDMIVPTADPRVPFGGRDQSGFGVTRGAEGLLELTRPRAVITRRGRRRPHLDAPSAGDGELFESYIKAAHGRSMSVRWRALRELLRAIAIKGVSR
jgi:acyl-CoA reductase-like NAD-dependent aldehyde dehydrogenase